MKINNMNTISRRKLLSLLGLIPAFTLFPKFLLAKTNQAILRIDEITKGVGAEDSDIYFDLPEIAENGNQVKLSFEIDSPMTKDNFVKSVYILADGNPAPDIAKFSFTPDMGSCSATTRIRLSKTQNVYLLSENNSGKFQMTTSKVKVTIGGCGG